MYRIGHHAEAGVPAPQLPNLGSNITSHMVELAVAPYLLESAAFVYWQAGLATFSVASGDIPPSLPFKLNTKTFREWAPAMYSAYPDHPMALRLGLAGQVTSSVGPPREWSAPPPALPRPRCARSDDTRCCAQRQTSPPR